MNDRHVLAERGPYRIELFRPEMFNGMASVLGHLLGPDGHRAGDYLRWKHLDYPSGEDPILLAVTCGERSDVVGMNGFLPMMWSDGAAEKGARLACWADFIIHPEHQRRGLGSLLLSETMKVLERRGFVAAISFSQNPVSTKLSLGLGWKPVGPATCARLVPPPQESGLSVVQWYRGSVAGRAVRLLKRRLGGGPKSVFAQFDRRRPSQHTDSSIEPRPGAMAILEGATGANGRLRLLRTKEYFSWRFRNPISRYRFLYLSRGDQLKGYLVLQEFLTRARGRAVVLDLKAGDPGTAVELIQSAMRQGGFRNMYMLAECVEPEVRGYLIDAGFTLEGPKNQVPSLIVKPLNTEPGGLSNRVLSSLNSWHFHLIDSDAF